MLISTLKKLQKYEICGYTDMSDKGEILGIRYLGNDHSLSEIRQTVVCAAIGIGKVEVNSPARERIVMTLESLGFELPVIISPNACVNPEVLFGKGTIVFDGVVINSGSVVGAYCVINTGCIIEHDCKLGKDVFISPGAVLCGGVNVGAHSVVGAKSVVIQGIKIVADCLIGAGSVVVKDLNLAGTYVGSPASLI